MDAFLRDNAIDIRKEDDREKLISFLITCMPEAEKFVNALYEFLHTDPQLPATEKNYIPTSQLVIPAGITREGLIEYLSSMRDKNELANLAFYAYRDMSTCDWRPFMKAAIERNPVSLEQTEGRDINDVCAWINSMENVSIYDAQRLAQPDEVVNYGRGDGLEKAILLANVYHNRYPEEEITVVADNSDAILKSKRGEYRFKSDKHLSKEVLIPFV